MKGLDVILYSVLIHGKSWVEVARFVLGEDSQG